MRVLARDSHRVRPSRLALACATIVAGALAIATPATTATAGTAGNDVAKASRWQILEPSNTGIPGDYVYSIAVDAKGNPWMTADDPIWDEGGLGELKGPKATVRQWTNVDGKSPEHFMRQLKFDAAGHPWAGGPAGLMEYRNGKVRAVWTEQNTPWPAHTVRDFGWDSKGDLWVALSDVDTGHGGVGRYDGTSWKVWTTANGLPFGSPWNQVESLEIDSQDRVWIGSPVRGAAMWNGKKWSLLGEPVGWMYDIAIAPDGTPWYVSATSGVRSWENGEWVSRTGDFGTGSMTAIRVDREGRIWVATATGAIWRWSGSGSEWDQVLRPPSLGSHIYGLAFLPDNRVVAGGIGGMAVQQKGGGWMPYTVESTGLSTRFIEDIMVDSTGRTWISNSAGIASTDGKTWTNFNRYSPPWPFDTDSALASARTPDGMIWVAPAGWGVGRWDGHTWTSYLRGTWIHSMTVDSEGRVWVVPDRGQAKRWDGSTFVDMGNPATGADLEDISADDEGNVWLAAGSGLYKYDGSTWTSYSTADLGFPSRALTAVAAEPTSGIVWVGADSGIARFDGTTATVYTDAQGLPANYVNTIDLAPNGHVWAGMFDGPPYRGGVAEFDGSTWTAYTTANSPLPHNQVQTLDVGADGRVWIGTASEGVAIFTPKA
jgi:ligand-binding sensor domain-containing protein